MRFAPVLARAQLDGLAGQFCFQFAAVDRTLRCRLLRPFIVVVAVVVAAVAAHLFV
jgi:hypothetical protein